MGTEFMVILEVEWAEGGSFFYSDQDVDGCEAKILSMGGFDTSMILEGSSDSQELGIVLEDTDGQIRQIYNTFDIHKRPARVYLLHKGLELADKILVFKGELVTPIQWDEVQRSVSFNVMSKLDSTQIGFSMEEGDFPNIPDEALGKAWPLVFGQVCHLPAVKVRAPRRGYLEAGTGIHDFTLGPRTCQAIRIQCPVQVTGTQRAIIEAHTRVPMTTETVGPDLECVNRRFGEICKLKDLYEQQVAYEHATLNIYNGVSFAQGEDTTIYIDNATYVGVFSGNIFTVKSRVHPEVATFNHQECQTIEPVSYSTVPGRAQIGGTLNVRQGAGGYIDPTSNYHNTPEGTEYFSENKAWIPDQNISSFYPNQTQPQAFQSCEEALTATPGMVGGPIDSWAIYDAMESSYFFWAPSGTEVYVEGEQEILYITSLLPGTVDSVSAYRTGSNGFRYLTEVPTDRYTVYETDYIGYEVVEIGMEKPLSHYVDSTTKESEGWEDQIYVSFTSSVGPNPCDIIEWLIGKYTNLTVDATSFAAVHSSLTNYPANFYTLERTDVYDLIKDIAYQSRCSVYVRNDIVYIKYLSTEPTSVRTLNESDILSGSFIESLSETEDVYTTHSITWRKAGAAVRADQTTDRKIVLKYNVDKYGTVEESWDYFIYNIYELVLKSSTFWLIRKANSWKLANFKLPIKHMDLDVGDCVTLDVSQFSASVKVVIESMKLNPDENTLDLSCWTPIRSGETSAYYWAWPSQQAAHQIWPLADDLDGGAGYDFAVTPPVGHLLLGGAHRDDQLVITTGDLHPSDLDDTYPQVQCEVSDYLNFNEKPPEIVAKEIAQTAARQAMENTMTGGGKPGAGGSIKTEGDACGKSYAGCGYKVDVQWHTSTRQGIATSQGGPSPPDGSGPCGGPCHCSGGCPSCTGPIWKVCHTFGAPWSARMFAQYMVQQYGNSTQGYWTCGQSAVIGTSVKNGDHANEYTNGGEDCEDVGSSSSTESPDGTVGGETAQPTGLRGLETNYCDYAEEGDVICEPEEEE
jgi:hypothetical protein